MTALRVDTASLPSKQPWQPFRSPISPASPGSAGFESSTSLSDRCRKLAFRLGGSAVHDDSHFHEKPASASEPTGASGARAAAGPQLHRHGSSSPSRSPAAGFHPNLSPANAAPPSPLSPRSHPPTSPESVHVLNEILEEGEGEPTPRAEDGPRGVYEPAAPSLGFAALAEGNGSGHAPWKPSALGISYGSDRSAAPSTASSVSGGFEPEDTPMDDDSIAVIEERVAEIQQQLQEGATWQGVDIWLSEGDLLVGPNQESLRPLRTFSTCWVEPLLRVFSLSEAPATSPRIRRRSSNFSHVKPAAPFQLVIRLHTPANITFPYVVDALQPLQDASLLTRYCPNARVSTPGLVTVVSSEAAGAEMVPLEDLQAIQGERFVYRDASLAALEQDPDLRGKLDPQVTPVAAGELLPTTGWDGSPPVSPEVRDRIQRQVAYAHDAGLKVRYEALPHFPVHVRETVRATLQELGVDYL